MNALHAHFPKAPKPSVAARSLLFCVRGYQYLLSPYFGTQCRFTPTCSHYAADALTKYGALKGGLMAARRILRCHPGRLGGFDPVP